MKTTKLAAALFAAMGLTTIAAPAMAYEAGDILVRGRVVNIKPSDDSGSLFVDLGSTGTYADLDEGVKVDNDTIPELDITYMITPNWGVELILGYSDHTVTTHKGADSALAGLGLTGSSDVIDTKVLPPTVTLQYHFNPTGSIRPYVGAGINYTYFFDEEVPKNSHVHQTGDKIKLDSSWGLAAQAGVDIAINQDWFVNLDVKYIDIDTEAHFKGIVADSKAKITADIDPIVWGIGIGRKF
jgi:outer membrane protein